MIQQDDAVRDFGVVGGNWLEGGLHSGDGREHWTQQLRLSRVNQHWQYLARRQLEHGAIILRKSILSKQARLEPSSSASFEVERGVLLGARSEIEPLSTNRRTSKLHAQGHGSQRVAVVFHRDEDLPRIRITERTAHTDFSQAAVFSGTGNGDEAEIRGQRE